MPSIARGPATSPPLDFRRRSWCQPTGASGHFPASPRESGATPRSALPSPLGPLPQRDFVLWTPKRAIAPTGGAGGLQARGPLSESLHGGSPCEVCDTETHPCWQCAAYRASRATQAVCIQAAARGSGGLIAPRAGGSRAADSPQKRVWHGPVWQCSGGPARVQEARGVWRMAQQALDLCGLGKATF